MNPAERNQAFYRIAAQQIGCTPHTNRRVLTVKGKQDGMRLGDFLSRLSGFTDRASQHRGVERGDVLVDGRGAAIDGIVRAGNQIEVCFRDVVEPPICPDLQVVFEDSDILVVNKPAPLPVHPSGRYNHHSLTEIGKKAWPELTLKPVHRLDAETAGILVLGKHAAAATALVECFATRAVHKRYRTRIFGQLPSTKMTIRAPIGAEPAGEAGVRVVHAGGKEAVTEVEQTHSFPDGTSLVTCSPQTGRTNQIRIHLAHVAGGIVGDRLYGDGGRGMDGAKGIELPLHLFASALRFPHPITGEPCTFEVPLPAWFENPLDIAGVSLPPGSLPSYRS